MDIKLLTSFTPPVRYEYRSKLAQPRTFHYKHLE